MIPSKLRRLAFILVKSFSAKIIDMIMTKIETIEVFRGNEKRIHLIRRCFSFLDKVHTCIFYYQGIYYDLAKRLTSIQYMKFGKEASDVKTGFRLLGHVATINLALNLIGLINQYQELCSPQSHSRSNDLEHISQISQQKPSEENENC